MLAVKDIEARDLARELDENSAADSVQTARLDEIDAHTFADYVQTAVGTYNDNQQRRLPWDTVIVAPSSRIRVGSDTQGGGDPYNYFINDTDMTHIWLVTAYVTTRITSGTCRAEVWGAVETEADLTSGAWNDGRFHGHSIGPATASSGHSKQSVVFSTSVPPGSGVVIGVRVNVDTGGALEYECPSSQTSAPGGRWDSGIQITELI
jgi:hypothetical protein